MFVSARKHYVAEAACYIAYTTVGLCACRARLSDEQGCCLTAHQDFFSIEFPQCDPVTLYNGCGVDRPEGCNNSPIDDSPVFTNNSPVSQVSTITATTTMIISFVLELVNQRVFLQKKG